MRTREEILENIEPVNFGGTMVYDTRIGDRIMIELLLDIRDALNK